jgi:hypothetical protein
MKPKSSNIKHLSIGIVVALILWSCGESSDSTNNAPSNINNGTDYVVLSSSQTSDYGCRDGETIKDKKGNIISFCLDGEWNAISKPSQTEPISNSCLDGEVQTNNITNYICSNGQWIAVVPISQGNAVLASSGSQYIYSSSDESSFIEQSNAISSSSIPTINSSSSNISTTQSSTSIAKFSSSSKVSWQYNTWCGWNNNFADEALNDSAFCAGFTDTYTYDTDESYSNPSSITEYRCDVESGGICGSFELNSGSDYDPAVVGLEIEIFPRRDSSYYYEFEGVCISYAVEKNAQLEIGFGDEDEYYEYDLPYVSLPKATSVVTKKFKWSEFRQGGWSRTAPKITGTEASKKMKFLKFKIQGGYGNSGNYKIFSIGPLDSGCRTE